MPKYFCDPAVFRNVMHCTPCRIIDIINTTTKPICVVITVSKAMEASHWLTHTNR
jgi:hypothetical protein